MNTKNKNGLTTLPKNLQNNNSNNHFIDVNLTQNNKTKNEEPSLFIDEIPAKEWSLNVDGNNVDVTKKKGGEFYCEDCDESFKTLYSLERHNKRDTHKNTLIKLGKLEGEIKRVIKNKDTLTRRTRIVGDKCEIYLTKDQQFLTTVIVDKEYADKLVGYSMWPNDKGQIMI